MKQISFQSVTASHLGVAYPIQEKHQASARHRPCQRYTFRRVVGGTLACAAMAGIFNIILINFLLFPDCNRVTRDCFLVQHLWGAK